MKRAGSATHTASCRRPDWWCWASRPTPPEAQLKFKEKEDLPYTLLADDKKEVAKQFDVLKEKNMYGKKVMGIVRSTFLIDPEGKIAQSSRP